MTAVAALGIDLGKNTCSIVGLDPAGAVVLRRRVRRGGLLALVGTLPPCVVAMEACCGAHHVARRVAAQGHTPRLMPPEYVRPYVKTTKNDDRDAEAVAEAASRPTMRLVEPKSEAQLDLQSLHRVRERLVGERTALANRMRGLLLERGVVVAKGRRALREALSAPLAEQAGGLGPRMRALLSGMRAEWEALDDRIASFDREFAGIARDDEDARRLAGVPGIGVAVATALVAAVGRGEAFGKGRDLAAWLGLVPRRATTGGKPRLLGISRRGSTCLRKPLIHGARAVLPRLAGSATPLGRWLAGLLARAHRNKAVVALANKLARIAWAVLRRGRGFEPAPSAAAWDGIGRRRAPGAADRGRSAGGEARWPDGRPAARQPGAGDGPRGRRRHEDRAARISIVAEGFALGPDTLQQTVPGPITEPLADGVGHTFFCALT